MLSVGAITSQFNDFQRNYLYEVKVLSCPGIFSNETFLSNLNTSLGRSGTSGASKALTVADLKASLQYLDLLSTSISLPAYKEAAIKVSWSGQYAYFPGPVDSSSGTGSMEFMVPRDWTGSNGIEAWCFARHNYSTGAGYPKAAVVGKLQVTAYDIDKRTITAKWVLRNFSFTGISALEFKKDGTDMLKCTVDYCFDWREGPQTDATASTLATTYMQALSVDSSGDITSKAPDTPSSS